MRDKGDHYEYIAVYVDDLLIASKGPEGHHRPPTSQTPLQAEGKQDQSRSTLVCDFFHDKDGKPMLRSQQVHREDPRRVRTTVWFQNPNNTRPPLLKGDHPEVDSSDLLDFEMTKIYQSLIGALQWVIQIGPFSMSRRQ